MTPIREGRLIELINQANTDPKRDNDIFYLAFARLVEAELAGRTQQEALTDAQAHTALGARGYREAFDAGYRAATSAANSTAPMQPSDGDYLRWAQREGATHDEHGDPRVIFHSGAQWGRFCDRIRSATPAPTQAAGGGASSITIDFRQATELLEMFGDEPTEITLMTGDGHSGNGLYAVYNADPEGSVYLGQTDEEAAPDAAPAAAVEPWMEQEAKYEKQMRECAAAAPEGLTDAFDAAVSHCDSNGICGIEPETLSGIVDAVVAALRPATPDAKTAEERKPMTEDKKRKLIGSYYADSWAMKAALNLIDEVERFHGIGDQP